MARRGVDMAWGEKGAQVLKAIDAPDSAMGCFLVLPPKKPGGPAQTAFSDAVEWTVCP